MTERVFVLASNNAHKLTELRKILGDLGFRVISQSEAGCDFTAEETGETFAENAYIKAKAAFDACSLPCIADDSGLAVEALFGAPGVRSARYGGDYCHTDAERCAWLLSNMDGVAHRRAKFVSSICCVMPDGAVIRAEGECQGSLLT